MTQTLQRMGLGLANRSSPEYTYGTMGQSFNFTCQECDYEELVAGGRDRGFEAFVETMTCQDCRQLVDVLIGYQGEEGPMGDPEYDEDLGVCPECQGKNLMIREKNA